MWTKEFWKQATERAVKSVVQAEIGAGVLDGANLLHMHWQLAGTIALGAALLSYGTSILTSAVGKKNDPSAVA